MQVRNAIQSYPIWIGLTIAAAIFVSISWYWGTEYPTDSETRMVPQDCITINGRKVCATSKSTEVPTPSQLQIWTFYVACGSLIVSALGTFVNVFVSLRQDRRDQREHNWKVTKKKPKLNDPDLLLQNYMNLVTPFQDSFSPFQSAQFSSVRHRSRRRQYACARPAHMCEAALKETEQMPTPPILNYLHGLHQDTIGVHDARTWKAALRRISP
jgi:hypothetical protein